MLDTAQPYSQPHIDANTTPNSANYGVAQEAYTEQLRQQRLIDFHLSEAELNGAASPGRIELRDEPSQDPRYAQALGAEAARPEVSPEIQVGSTKYIDTIGSYLEMTRNQFGLGA